ncbi:MAG TPA: copper resistance protein CopC [Gemmatimonadaceae bacterium]|nr:copper resistance protein CopC [Gemmatimonadaceae bacterium]
MNPNRLRRRSFRAAFFVLGLGLAAPAVAGGAAKALHATLLRSTPAADARLTTAPRSIRLVFSEPIVAELSRIVLTGPEGRAENIPVVLDAAGANTLVGSLPALPNGQHLVAWRIVSADGHPVSGRFSFSLAQAGLDSALFPPLIPEVPATRTDSTSAALVSGDDEGRPVPKVASLLRGLGLGAMMAGVGLLFFGSAARNRRNLDPASIATRFLGFGAVLLAAHMGAWLYHISPGAGLSGTFGFSALKSTPGIVESARVVLAFLAFWAMAKGKRGLALFFGLACLVVSGAVGHSAAIDPLLAIPAKSAHLIGAAIWMGGLVWLGWTFRRDITAFRIEARRVSSAALIAFIVVAGSGLAQTLIFLDLPDLFSTDYGRTVLGKITGLLILMLLGGYNRFRLVPNLDDSRKGRKLSRSATQGLLVMLALVLISGVLANIPVPKRPAGPNTGPVFPGS